MPVACYRPASSILAVIARQLPLPGSDIQSSIILTIGDVRIALFVRGKVILQPHGKEFFTWYSKQFFTTHGKDFFLSSVASFITGGSQHRFASCILVSSTQERRTLC